MNIPKDQRLIPIRRYAGVSKHDEQTRGYREPSFFLLSALLLVIIILASCGGSDASGPASSQGSSTAGQKVNIAGSTALLPLAAKAADLYHQSHPDVQLTVKGGGSLAGLDAVSKNQVDIGNSDIYADPAVYPDPNLTDHIVCANSFALIVDPQVTISSLSTQQIIDIFTGKIVNWQDVGGPNLSITPVIRPATSGTRALFRKYVMGGLEESVGTSSPDSSTAILDAVAHTSGAISYITTTAINANVRMIGIDGVSPTVQNIQAGKYKFWGYEHMYTLQNGVNATTEFLDFMQSPQVQQLVQQLGYISITAVKSLSSNGPANG